MMTSKNSYWKNEVFKNITKKIIIRKLIILLITAIIVFIPCYVMYNYIIHMPYSVVGSPNDFIQIQVALNSGISFSMFADSGFAVVFAWQFVFSLMILTVIVFINGNRIYIGGLGLIFFGGLFNTFDRLVDFNLNYLDFRMVKRGMVLDYFKLKSFPAIFNLPDVFIIIGTIVFVLGFIFAYIKRPTRLRVFDWKINASLPINLFIDVTQNKCNLCLFQNDEKFIKYFTSIKTQNNITDIVIERINSMLMTYHMIPADITDLYITTGPGSFTGCRINTLIAKAWATTDNVKVHAIDSLAFQAGNKECLSLIDAKGNKCYYLLNEAKQKKIGIVPLNEIHQLNKHHLPIVIDFKNVDIVNNLRECYKHFKIVDVKKLTPLYIKPAI